MIKDKIGEWGLSELEKIGASFHSKFPEAHAAEGMLAILGAVYLSLGEIVGFVQVDESLRSLRKRVDHE